MLIEIWPIEDKENQNFYIGPKDFHNVYNNRQYLSKNSDNCSEFEEYYKQSEDTENLKNPWKDDQFGEQDSLKQNTQDYRKREDFALGEISFNFSDEKNVSKFTRCEIYTNQQYGRKISDDSEPYNMSHDSMQQKAKNYNMYSRYEFG